jgi:hypothetical protein
MQQAWYGGAQNDNTGAASGVSLSIYTKKKNTDKKKKKKKNKKTRAHSRESDLAAARADFDAAAASRRAIGTVLAPPMSTMPVRPSRAAVARTCAISSSLRESCVRPSMSKPPWFRYSDMIWRSTAAPGRPHHHHHHENHSKSNKKK